MATYYPPLDVDTLRNLEVVRALAKEQPDYFKDSPYSPEVERLVGAIPAQRGAESEGQKAEAEAVDVLQELTSTLKELKDHKPDKEDASASMGYYRTKTSLLEKIVELMDRGKNQKDISEFYAFVLVTLEEVCTPDQVSRFSDKLKEFAK